MIRPAGRSERGMTPDADHNHDTRRDARGRRYLLDFAPHRGAQSNFVDARADRVVIFNAQSPTCRQIGAAEKSR
jgi:hypothetical protein